MAAIINLGIALVSAAICMFLHSSHILVHPAGFWVIGTVTGMIQGIVIAYNAR